MKGVFEMTLAKNEVKKIGNHIANIEDVVEWFEPKIDRMIQGKVIYVREKVVIVQFLEPEIEKALKLENDRTVVNHRKYKVVEKSQLPRTPIKKYDYFHNTYIVVGQ